MTPLSPQMAPVPTNIDPRPMSQQEPYTNFTNASQAVPYMPSELAVHTEPTSINDLSTFNTNNYNQYFLPTGNDEFIYEPSAADRFDAVNISGPGEVNIFNAELWQI